MTPPARLCLHTLALAAPLLSARPAWAAGSPAPSVQGLSMFALFGFLCLFGYLMYTNYTINSRIDRLDASVSNLPTAEDPGAQFHAAFSWDPALRQGRPELTLFGESLPLSLPGVHMLGSTDAELTAVLAANLVSRSMALDSTYVVFASSKSSMEVFGQRLLSLEAGVAWNSITTQEQDRHLRKLTPTLARYQSHLHLVTDLEPTAEALLGTIQKLHKADPEAAIVVVLEEPLPLTEATLPRSWIDRLEGVSVRAQCPILLLSTVASTSVAASWESQLGRGVKTMLCTEYADPQRSALHVELVRGPQQASLSRTEVTRPSQQITNVV